MMNSIYRLSVVCAGMISAAHRACFLMMLVILWTGTAQCEEVKRLKAPAGQSMVEYARGGVYYVDKSQRDEYDRLLFRVRALRSDLDTERIGGAEAMLELRDLHARLEELRKDIEQKKTLVATGTIHKESETVLFDLGPARLLVISADNLRVEGWEGPQVKCVLEKFVLIPDDKPAKEQLQGIKLVHRHGLAPKVVGKTPAEQEADEQKFLASPQGQKLDAQARDFRRQETAARYDHYKAFQGKKIDTLRIDGLEEQEGNHQIRSEITGENESCRHIEMQRHAALTVYVPACQALALQQGYAECLEVQGVHGNLLVEGSIYNRYNSLQDKFSIRDVEGSLLVRNTPLRLIESIRGDVNIPPPDGPWWSASSSGSSYVGGENQERLVPSPPARSLTCRNIGGDLTVWFLRTELKVEEIAGRIDVTNQFGNTTIVAGHGMANRPHRVVSESGRIEAQLASESLGALSLRALTNCGTVRTNASYRVIGDMPVLTFSGPNGMVQYWRGMISNRETELGSEKLIERVRAVVDGVDPTSALNLISRGGMVRIVYKP